MAQQTQQTQSAEMSAVMAELAKLKAENERLRAEKAKGQTLTLKVSEKGAISLYGIGRYPATFYREQWERILAIKPQIEKFIADNADKLSTKE